jgi:HEAT repeat protein
MARASVASAVLCLILTGMTTAQDDKKKDGGVQPDGLKNLRHPDASIRYRTAALLAEQGPRAKFAIEELREALKDADPLVRVKVAEAIWMVEKPSPTVILPGLQRALKDKDREVRAAACGVIGLMGARARAAVPLLIEAIKDKELTVVIGAVNALGDIGPPAAESAGALLQLAGYGDFVVVEPFAGAALGAMGTAVVPELTAALGDKSLERRRVAAYALGSIGPDARPAVKALTERLRDVEPSMRFLAARALGSVGKEAKSALPRLRDATSDKDTPTRIRAALAVWEISGETAFVVVLSDALADKTPSVRHSAASALAAMGADAKQAVGPLVKVLGDMEPTVRQCAIVAIGSIGKAAVQSTEALRPLLKDTDKLIRVYAAFALWQVSGDAKEPLATLRPMLAEASTVQSAAIAKIGAMGQAASALLPDLVTMYRGEDSPALRGTLAQAIKGVDPAVASKLGIR